MDYEIRNLNEGLVTEEKIVQNIVYIHSFTNRKGVIVVLHFDHTHDIILWIFS